MPAFTSNLDAAIPPGYSPAPSTLVPNHSNENVDPNNDGQQTAPASPNKPKPFEPSTPLSKKHPTPRSTTLHRHFLKEVSMSPATPPRKQSPTKVHVRNDSPNKGRDSPTKQKLEVGQSAFYFSCELPMSKVTPKKGTPCAEKMEVTPRSASPQKQTHAKPGEQTPSKALPASPLRKKNTPQKVITRDCDLYKPNAGGPKKSASLFGTSLRNVATPDPAKQTTSAGVSPTKSNKKDDTTMSGGSRKFKLARPLLETPLRNATTSGRDDVKVSPTKSIKMAPRFIASPKISTVPTSRMPATSTKDGPKKEAMSRLRDTSSLGNSPQDALDASTTSETRIKSARKSSFDIGDLMAGLGVHLSKPPRTAAVEHVGESDLSEPPTPMQKAAEKLQISPDFDRSIGRLPRFRDDAHVAEEANPSAGTATEASVTIPFRIHEQTLQYQPLSSPKPYSELEHKPVEGLSLIEKRVSFQDHNLPSSNSPKPVFVKTPRRTGTDPVVLLAMQKEMDTLKQSLSSSLGIDFRFSGEENTFELPAMANSLPNTRLASDKAKGALLHTTPDVSNAPNLIESSMDTIRTSMPIDRKQAAVMPTPSKPTKARWPHVGRTPADAQSGRVAATVKEGDSAQWQTETSVATGQHRVRARPVFNATGSKATAPRRYLKVTKPATKASTRLRITPDFKHVESSTAPAKLEPIGTGIPRSARKSAFEKPARSNKSASASKSHKSILSNPRSTFPSTTDKDALRPPTTSRSGFASAADIADRVARWNSESRKRADTNSPRRTTTHSPSKSKAKANEPEKSYTPEGSPTKPGSKPSSLVPPRVKATAHLTPNRIAPKAPTTPAPTKNPALRRLRGPVPRTPTSSHSPDPNAFRTPSKEIESSLDQAIDRKIAEDARSGREFTPSGNRVKELLEAKRRAE